MEILQIFLPLLCYIAGVLSDSEPIQKACGYMSEIGPCDDDYTMKYFYHPEHGDCSRFWYGGCGGNLNRFETEDECRTTCINPPGRAACNLPKVRGPCTKNYKMYYFDSDEQKCKNFDYGGCLGNANRFESFEDCRRKCIDVEESDITSHVGEREKINVAKSSLNIPDSCTDNRNFANCAEVIRRNYCEHTYYKKFCCRSCALARQV